MDSQENIQETLENSLARIGSSQDWMESCMENIHDNLIRPDRREMTLDSILDYSRSQERNRYHQKVTEKKLHHKVLRETKAIMQECLPRLVSRESSFCRSSQL